MMSHFMCEKSLTLALSEVFLELVDVCLFSANRVLEIFVSLDFLIVKQVSLWLLIHACRQEPMQVVCLFSVTFSWARTSLFLVVHIFLWNLEIDSRCLVMFLSLPRSLHLLSLLEVVQGIFPLSLAHLFSRTQLSNLINHTLQGYEFANLRALTL